MLIAILPLVASLCAVDAPSADATPAASAEVDAIAAGLVHERPGTTIEAAREHAIGALSAQYRELTAPVLLGLALRESDLRLDAAPQCGTLQATITEIGGRANCAAARSSVLDSYRLGVKHLAADLDLCRSWKAKRELARGVTVLGCLFNLYGEGYSAGKRGWGVKGCAARTHCDRSLVPLAHARRIEAAGNA